jgi:hypothetical protein
VRTVTTFATAVDVTLAGLKLEAFLPVDQATAGTPGSAGVGPFAAGGDVLDQPLLAGECRRAR